MLDKTFLRPVAHRGLHTMMSDGGRARVENSASAFQAAAAKGYAIECDLQPARCGTAMVHHDETLERLSGRPERVDALNARELSRVRYGAGTDHVITLADLVAIAGGKVPLVVEIKSEWRPLPAAFLDDIAAKAAACPGPIALMSFDPVVLVEMRARVPDIPRGIVAGWYARGEDDAWWSDVLSADRQHALTHLLETGPCGISFVNYHLKALPTPVTQYVRSVQGLPIMTWTVRSEADMKVALAHADAPVFEGIDVG